MSVWIFTHSDGDGLCAGAIALAANPEAYVFFTHPFGLLDDLSQVKDGDEVVICDIALSQAHLPRIVERLSAIAERGTVTYIDHHPLPEDVSPADVPGEVVNRTTSSASELAYARFRPKLSLLQSRTAIYGAIADYMDHTSLIQRLLTDWDKRTIYLETGILVQGIMKRKRDYDFKRSIVKKLAGGIPPSFQSELVRLAIESTHEEEVMIRGLGRYVRTRGRIAYALDVPFSLGKVAIYARAIAGSPVGIGGESRRGMIDMSLRTHDERIDLNRLLRRIATRHGGSGGGHPLAAGARVPKESFSDFIDDLDEAVSRSLSD